MMQQIDKCGLKKTLSLLLVVTMIMGLMTALGTEKVRAEEVATENGYFTIEDGVLTDYSGTDTEVTIPDTVTSIGDSAFYGCDSLTSITIPDTVTSIGNAAFYECSALESITIPDTVTSIGDGAFYECNSLESITIPDTVTSIVSYSFYGCSSLTSITIPDTVTSIGWYAFSWCSALESITIPEMVASIGGGAFLGCSALESITIPDTVTSIEEETFWGCSSLTSITIPDTVTSIGGDAFYECNSLESITIPDTVTSIEWHAFWGCSSLTSITIPDTVTSIGRGAFSGCSALESIEVDSGNLTYDSRDNCNAIIVTESNELILGCANTMIPDTVTSIGDSAFSGCSALEGITIPDTVTSIGYSAFSGCSALESITIPEMVTSIDSSTFSGCSSLTSITIPDTVTSIAYDAFYECGNLTTVNFKGLKSELEAANYLDAFPENVTTIVCEDGTIEVKAVATENGEFRILDTILIDYSGTDTEVTIPDTVTSIFESAFYMCSSLTSITIPDTVTSIGRDAFCECSALESFTIPNSVTYTGENSFKSCEALESVTIPDTVTSIGNGVFSGCEALTSILIPDSITSIGDSAFSWCGSLTSITIPDSVESIGAGAFYECGSLTSVTIPDTVTNIGDDAFSFCESLTSITIPNSVTSIGTAAFHDCTALEIIEVDSGNSIYDSRDNCNAIIVTESNELVTGCANTVIPNSVTSIGAYAFFGCSGLTNILIPDSVTSIGLGAFYACTSLANITIPDSVESIGEGAFEECYALTSVTIPNSVTSIGDFAFDWCGSLTTVYYTGTMSDFEEKFSDVFSSDVTIICEDGTIEGEEDTEDEDTDYDPTTDISLSFNLATGSSMQLSAQVSSDNDDETVTWSTSDSQIATVSENGLVKAVRYGKAIITAMASDGSTANCAVQTRFKDVAGTNVKGESNYQYYFDPVYWAADEGITTGYDGVYFGVGENCTRAAVMIFLWRLAGCPTPENDAGTYFTDLKAYGASTATNQAVAWAYEQGISKGYSNGTFGVKSSITRKDVLIMLYRFAGKPDVTGTMKFSDCKSYGATTDTYKAILWGSQNGITSGYSNGTFKPTANCLREQIITFLYRYNLLQEEEEPTSVTTKITADTNYSICQDDFSGDMLDVTYTWDGFGFDTGWGAVTATLTKDGVTSYYVFKGANVSWDVVVYGEEIDGDYVTTSASEAQDAGYEVTVYQIFDPTMATELTIDVSDAEEWNLQFWCRNWCNEDQSVDDFDGSSKTEISNSAMEIVDCVYTVTVTSE